MALLLVVGGIAATVDTAAAHRDGCHRWHSCPSDSGSYVCGDLGYYDECPGRDPGGADESETSGSPGADLDPPKKPRVTDPAVSAGGRVRFDVRAERGARVLVRDERGRRVLATTATGATQSLRFRAADGTHVYAITAVDRAGNESAVRTLRLTVDTVPPPLEPAAVVPPRQADVGVHVTFSSEPGARFFVAAQEDLRGRTGAGLNRRVTGRVPDGGDADVLLWLPDGQYGIVVRVVDGVGNVARRTLTTRVDLPRPLLSVTRRSAPNESPVVWSVSTSAGTSGRFTWPGQAPVEFTADEDGRATVAVDLPDGAVSAAEVTATDPLGRRVLARTAPFMLDLTPPRLDVQADPEAAADGVLALRIATEPNTDVQVQVRPVEGQTIVASGKVFAGAAPVAWNRHVEEGRYVAEVVTTDTVGNETRRSVEVEVETPLTPEDLFALWFGLLLLQLVIGGLAAAVLLGRPKLAPLLRRGRAALDGRAEVRRYRVAIDRHARAVAGHEAELRRYEAATSAWRTRSEELDRLQRLAEGRLPVIEPPAGSRVALRSAERVHAVAAAVMVEERPAGGDHRLVPVLSGLATVTDRRVVFEGDRQREWLYERVTELRDLRPDTVLLTVTNRKHTSGLRFTADAEQLRLLVALALADFRGSRADVVALVQNLLAAHRNLRPVPPAAPPEPPAPPAAREDNGFEIASIDLRGSSVPTGARGTHTG